MNFLTLFRSRSLTLQGIALASLLGSILTTVALYEHWSSPALCLALGALLGVACSFRLPRLAILLSVLTLGLLTPLAGQFSIPLWLWLMAASLFHLSLINQLIKSHG